LGVVFGGWLVDRKGGYQGKKQTALILRLNCIMLMVAVGCCAVVSVVPNVVVVMTLIWVLLFAGGSVVPSNTGILMSSVPQDMREFASAMSQIASNVLGYFLAPTLSGFVMEETGSNIAWGFRLVLWWSGFALIAMVFAYQQALVNLQKIGGSLDDRPAALSRISEKEGSETEKRTSSMGEEDTPVDPPRKDSNVKDIESTSIPAHNSLQHSSSKDVLSLDEQATLVTGIPTSPLK